MTTESPRRTTRGRWPLGLLGMLALVAATERYIAGRDVDLATFYAIEWRLSAKAARAHAPKADVLCFGTSLTRLGVSPNIIEERTGHSAYNLSLSGGQPYASYMMLRHAIDAGARPRAIVVEFKWTSIFNDPVGLERVLPEIASLGECARLALAMRDMNYLARIALVAELPSYRCRVEVRANILAAIQGKEPVRHEQWATMALNMRANKGSHHTPKVPYDGKIEADNKQFFPPDWKCHPINEVYVGKFLDLAQSLDVPIFWLLPPVAPATQRRLDEIGASSRYTRFVERMAARHPSVVVLDGRGSGYPVDVFIDATHLCRIGTADLSNAVADAIKERLDGHAPPVRWAALPPFRGGRGYEKLEDYTGSHERLVAAFQAKAEAKRLADAAKGGARR